MTSLLGYMQRPPSDIVPNTVHDPLPPASDDEVDDIIPSPMHALSVDLDHSPLSATTFLGSGGYGSVYMCVSGNRAVKVTEANAFGLPAATVRELATVARMEAVGCRAVVKPARVAVSPSPVGHTMLFMDRWEMSLAQWVAKADAVSPNDLRVVTFSLLLALRDMHDACGLVHCDVKSHNVLVSTNSPLRIGDVALCDFGLVCDRASCLSPNITGDASQYKRMEKVQTIDHRAPEVMLGGGHYDEKIDIWSVGIVMMNTSKPPCAAPGEDTSFTEYGILTSMMRRLGRPRMHNDMVWGAKYDMSVFPTWDTPLPLPQWCGNAVSRDADAADLMLKLLSWDPQQRPSAAQALQHPYFAEYRRCALFPLPLCSNVIDDWQPQTPFEHKAMDMACSIICSTLFPRVNALFLGLQIFKRWLVYRRTVYPTEYTISVYSSACAVLAVKLLWRDYRMPVDAASKKVLEAERSIMAAVGGDVWMPGTPFRTCRNAQLAPEELQKQICEALRKEKIDAHIEVRSRKRPRSITGRAPE